MYFCILSGFRPNGAHARIWSIIIRKVLDFHVFLLRNVPHLGAGAIRATPIEDTGAMGVAVWIQPSGVESIAQK